jgi:ABC-type transport system involved in cytochrome bd biosynthesis fused ATPase/permease subunit
MSIAEGLHEEVDELVAHIDVWRTYGAADSVERSLDELSARSASATARAEGARAALSSANEVLAAIVLLVCVVAARSFSLPLSDGTLIAFAVPFFMAYRPLRDLGDARTALERGAAALASIEEAARATPPRGTSMVAAHSNRASDERSERPVERQWGHEILSVRGLGVSRDDRKTSFDVRAGELVAIVGPTGSGKTTLLRAMLGLEPTATGSVRYGDIELAHAGVGPAERPFTWAPQDAPLLAGTLVDNVLVARGGVAERGAARGDGRPNMAPRDHAHVGDARRDDAQRDHAFEDKERAFDVLRSIGAERLARECDGVMLGSAGRAVSGGERKWIALARAIACDLPVLLLDEPTAGLDVDAQEKVLVALRVLARTRAVIVVTHLPSIDRFADRVVAIGETSTDQNWASKRGSFSNSNRISGMS